MSDSATVARPDSPVLVFDRPSRPKVSVIVLAWRLTAELLDLLRSLRASADPPAFDLHLVLNGADEAVREAVAQHVRGAYSTSVAANVGFGGGCNLGAAEASGEYLAFLNDDAVLAADWLSVITAFADDADRRVGAVCSLLLHPDGTVQEAGSRVRADAGTVQFAEGMTLAAAEGAGLLRPRRVDYGSAAALLVRRTDFEAVGGFDPLFEPAYYEDVDLCFRLTASSREVWLAPDARATHHSGLSTVSDRRFREFASSRSGRRFIARWSPTLEHAPEHEAPVEQICRPDVWGMGENASVAPHSAELTAVEIQRSYARWLDERLAVAEAELETERELRRAETGRLQTEADSLRVRVADLESRGPLGLALRQASLFVRRLRARPRPPHVD